MECKIYHDISNEICWALLDNPVEHQGELLGAGLEVTKRYSMSIAAFVFGMYTGSWIAHGLNCHSASAHF